MTVKGLLWPEPGLCAIGATMPPPLTFAIGDVHGCHPTLLELLAPCRAHAPGQDHRFLFSRDYVDRGPDSRAVIATLRDLEQHSTCNVICLMGNHEELMLEAIDSGDPTWWLNNGGGETLQSYGIGDQANLPPGDVAW